MDWHASPVLRLYTPVTICNAGILTQLVRLPGLGTRLVRDIIMLSSLFSSK